MAIHLWTTTKDWWFTILSRFLEKGPQYPLHALQMALQLISEDIADIKTVVLWTDGPSQFKNRFLIGTQSYGFLCRWRWDKVHAEVGCPKHFKDRCDSRFGVLSGILKTNTGADLLTVEDVASLYRLRLQSSATHASRLHHVVDFMPGPGTSLPMTLVFLVYYSH